MKKVRSKMDSSAERKNPEISVVIPMYNEEENVKATLGKVKGILEGLDDHTWEILVVNDGSIDRTLELAEEMSKVDDRIRIVSYYPNIGRGRALRRGFDEARGDIVVTTDADLSYEAKYIGNLAKELIDNRGLDLVIGSPYMEGGGTTGVPFHRVLVSRLGNKILGFSLAGNLKTTTGILRAYRKYVVDSLELESDDKEIHLEILSKALALGYEVKEIPAVLTGRVKGKSKFKFRATAISHLFFSFFEKPVLIFGLIGLLFLLLGLIGGIYIIILRYQGALTPNRPLVTLVVLLILSGIQILSFGFIGTQIVALRKEIYKVQKQYRLIRENLKSQRE